MLVITTPAGFELFTREAGKPARALTVPPPDEVFPGPEELTEIAARYGIEIVGPPLEAR